eukprot:TRINITY_DN2569_c0_g1_i2.p1 TRINITY_DN2569_c0_g1~~TRINITY_DN2569_c0_g1_i2.p1  ORF type:complete len:533 (-),score=77.61 TRINITY_DN2569_c0_g1_i2:44-1642(-)
MVRYKLVNGIVLGVGIVMLLSFLTSVIFTVHTPRVTDCPTNVVDERKYLQALKQLQDTQTYLQTIPGAPTQFTLPPILSLVERCEEVKSKICKTPEQQMWIKDAISEEELSCKSLMGFDKVEHVRKIGEEWCTPIKYPDKKDEGREINSNITCYIFGRELYCSYTNLAFDPTGISKEDTKDGLFTYDNRPFYLRCTQQRAFSSGQTTTPLKEILDSTIMIEDDMTLLAPKKSKKQTESLCNAGDTWIDYPVYFLSRVNYDNSFSMLSAYFNAWFQSVMAGIQVDDWQVVFVDEHPKIDNLESVWTDIFSPRKRATKITEYRKKMCFKNVYFSSPESTSPLFGYGNHNCWNTELINAFRRFVLHRYNLIDLPQEGIATITFSVRRDYQSNTKRNGQIMRKMKNENENSLRDMMSTYDPGMVKFGFYDFARMTYKSQVELMASTDIFIGVHGAGMGNLVYLPPGAVVVEIGNKMFANMDQFQRLSKWSGHQYHFIKVESNTPDPEYVEVNVDDLKNVLDILIESLYDPTVSSTL